MSTFKLLEDYCVKHGLPTPKPIIRYGTYGGSVGLIEIGDKTYRDNNEKNHTTESTDAAAVIALRDLLDLN